MSDLPPKRLFPSQTGMHQLNSPPLVGVAEFVQSDVTCSGCGYNLRGQSRAGRCPECGLSVIDAVRRSMLIYADKAWLVRVRSGVTLVFWAIGASILGMCVFMIWAAAIGFSHMASPQAGAQFVEKFQIPGVLIGIFSVAYIFLVLHRLTTPEPEPGAPRPSRTGRARAIMTIACVALAFQLVNATVMVALGPQDPFVPASTGWLTYSIIVAVAGNILYLFGLVLLMLHLRAIARRDRSPGLGHLFTLVMWGGAVSVAVFGFAGVFFIWMAMTSPQSYMYATTMTTTNVGGVVVQTSTPFGASATHTTTTTAPSTMPTSSPAFAPYAGQSAMMAGAFLFGGIMIAGECFGFVVFVLAIVAAVQFYRALSWGINENVGAPIFAAASSADSSGPHDATLDGEPLR